jgi:hypothetical protein
MTLEDRIKAFVRLGERFENFFQNDFSELAIQVENNNPWFTPENTKSAIQALRVNLTKEKLEKWIEPYDLKNNKNPKSIGILMAGNIPAVGFDDLLCVLMAGHQACVKLSSSDQVLMKWIIDQLIAIEPRFDEFISIEEMLKSKTAYIATGSDNSARYFDYYFGKYPHIIRKNRTSVGILDGSENNEDFLRLAEDVFQYFGLGCRNVSKIYIKDKSQLIGFLDAIGDFKHIANHYKYFNNYEYNKSIYLVNKDDHLDNGFLLLKESDLLVSPIAVLFYQIYDERSGLDQLLSENKEKIQCIVSNHGWYPGTIDFGNAQCPSLGDYADGVDTLSFLSGLD